MKEKKVGALGGKVWTSILLFGLIGQIAWVVENMYFSRFMQNEITRAPYATTLMVVFSAIFATVSTLSALGFIGTKAKENFLFVGATLFGVLQL